MNHRIAGLATALIAVTALGLAYYAQFVLLLTPCELCLWERWPYRIVVVLGLLAVLFGGRFLLGLASLVLFCGAGIAGLHVGVEFGWWKSPLPECNGALAAGAPLPMFPAVPCDRPVFLLPHFPVSMAAMDFCCALAFAIILGAYMIRKS